MQAVPQGPGNVSDLRVSEVLSQTLWGLLSLVLSSLCWPRAWIPDT